jgi:hypothetical protein
MKKDKKDNVGMTESELSALINDAKDNSTYNDSSFNDKNEKLMKQYFSEKYGDEIESKSQVVTSEISDTVESYYQSLERIFLSDENNFKFIENSDDQDDIQEAADKTELVNYIISKQKNSFKINADWIRCSLIQKIGVLKTLVEDTKETEEHTFSGVTSDELVDIEESLQSENVISIEIVSKTELETGLPDEAKKGIRELIAKTHNISEEDAENITEDELVEATKQLNEMGISEFPDSVFDVTFKVIRSKRNIKIINIQNDNFVISSDADDIDEAEIVGDIVEKTRGQLLSEGYDYDLVDSLVSKTKNSKTNYDNYNDNDINDWASEKVELFDAYIKIDYDGDGIAERRHVLLSGNKILINEVFNQVPYAINTCVPVPFSVIGRSIAEMVQQNQRIQTVMTRALIDNQILVNNTRTIANENVEISDLLNVVPNGIIRTNSENPVGQDVMPLYTEYTGDKTLLAMQHFDARRTNTTGQQLSNQGLDKDQISKETATRFQGMKDSGAAKVESVARNFAEYGYKRLANIVAWFLKTYQDEELQLYVLGRKMKISPSSWKFDHIVEVDYIDKTKELENLQAIYAIQNQEKANGSLLVDDLKIYNTTKDIIKSLGKSDVSKYFNNPEMQQEVMFAALQQAQQQIQQMQAIIQQSQDQLAKAAEIEAQGKLIEAQAKQQLEVAKLQEEQRQFNQRMIEENEIKNKELALKVTELELKYNKDLNSQIKDNNNI